MTDVQLGKMPHGRFVTVDLEHEGDWPSAPGIREVYSVGTFGIGLAVLRFPTASAAGEFVRLAPEGLVHGRNTTERRARELCALLVELARQAFDRDNRFLEVWVERDGRVRYRQMHSRAREWRLLPQDRDTVGHLVVHAMIAALGVAFE